MPSEIATIAQTIRSEIRAAVKAGKIKLPEGAKVSVRSDTYAGGGEINASLRGLSYDWAVEDGRLTKQAQRLGEQIAKIMWPRLTWQWGGVDLDGLVLASIPRRGWTPGQD